AQTCLSVPRPALWWPSGYGAQPLYDLHMQLRRDDTVLDGLEDRVGLRTVELDRTPDPEEAGAESFTFRINGVRIFAKGANWIPLDCLSGRMDRPRYEELLDLLVEAHGNMLRVWGGGQYEKDDFYRLADERGILVWHDFMFACARYPDDPDFIAEVRAEAEHQVRRLRNRTCVVLWAGNNENDWIEDASNRAEPGHDFPGKSLYHRHLPEIVRRLDPSRPYWPSSPYGGDDHNGEQAGDRHNWHVWHGGVLPRRFGEEPRRDPSPEGVSYRHYLEDTARFASEFGMHASPVLETLRRNLPASELSFGSEGLLFRNKDTPKDKGNALMLAHTGLPRDLDEYIDLSMICQAEGLKLALEHYRRRKFHCSGALFWQWNDCWPGLSWSVLDYYAFPKASYFFVKRAYAPVLASFAERPDGAVEVWLTNDLPAPVDETLTWTHATFDGQVLDRGEVHAHGPANASMCVARVEPGGGGRRGQFLWLEGGDRVPYNRHFFAEVKDLVRERPAVSVEWERSGDALVATLVCERHAYFVNLFAPVEGTRYSDNWFDLFPDKPRRVSIRPPEGARLGPEGVEVAWR
ncbi:MAG: beta-mannosidase, partial [Actinomycetota bacterium]